MRLPLLCLTAFALATPAMAQDFGAQLKARQGQFRIMAINLGILGEMAKGEAEYNAEAAVSSAESIRAVSMINQGPLWPEGSSEMGIEGTRAKANIWDNFDDFADKWSKLNPAAENLVSVAGNGQEALGPALGQLGDACKACHDEYRVPQN